uniref:Uncharacterized protein n=1 Tax=Pavo cristatus TaxID=9049 RepID=A0A8C9EUN9_PAVCR
MSLPRRTPHPHTVSIPTPPVRTVPGSSAPDPRPRPLTPPLPAALGLRTPMGVQSPYSFSMAHPAVNGDMAGAGAYASLHLVSPQLNGTAAAGSYGRSPLVRFPLPAGLRGFPILDVPAVLPSPGSPCFSIRNGRGCLGGQGHIPSSLPGCCFSDSLTLLSALGTAAPLKPSRGMQALGLCSSPCTSAALRLIAPR